ncbi:MAG: hypothetical protein ACE5KT_00315 [Methanosarcinales archaeon]
MIKCDRCNGIKQVKRIEIIDEKGKRIFDKNLCKYCKIYIDGILFEEVIEK